MAIDGRLTSKENIYTNDLFVATIGNLASQTFTWNELYVGTQEGGKDMSSDSFFTSTDYKGAVKSNNVWTKGGAI